MTTTTTDHRENGQTAAAGAHGGPASAGSAAPAGTRQAAGDARLADARQALLARWRSGGTTTRTGIGRRGGDGPAPASFTQEALWFLTQIHPNNPFYNMSMPLRLAGDLDVGALRAAVAGLVARHEALRTGFRSDGGRPVQVVAGGVPTPLTVWDAPTAGIGTDPDELDRWMRARAHEPFDITAPPLVGFDLLRLGPAEHILVIRMHHLVGDGLSMGVLAHEFGALYEAALRGAAADLPVLPIQFADFATWQRGPAQSAVVAAGLEYWRARLADRPAPLALPADRPRPAQPTFLAESQQFQLPEPASRALRELARDSGATPYMLMVAAFTALLHRYSGATDVLVGSAVHGRDRPETAGLIGFFANTLVMRTDLAGDPTFTETLARVRDTCLDAFRHGDTPFESIVAELSPGRDLTENPIFRVSLVQQRLPDDGRMADLDVSLAGGRVGIAQYGLVVHCWERDELIAGTLVGSRDLFDHATVARMAGHLETLLAAVAADPTLPLSRVPLLTTAETAAALATEAGAGAGAASTAAAGTDARAAADAWAAAGAGAATVAAAGTAADSAVGARLAALIGPRSGADVSGDSGDSGVDLARLAGWLGPRLGLGDADAPPVVFIQAGAPPESWVPADGGPCVVVVVDDVLPRTAADAVAAAAPAGSRLYFLHLADPGAGYASLTRIEPATLGPATGPSADVPGVENVPVGLDRLGAVRVVDAAGALAPVGVTGTLVVFPDRAVFPDSAVPLDTLVLPDTAARLDTAAPPGPGSAGSVPRGGGAPHGNAVARGDDLPPGAVVTGQRGRRLADGRIALETPRLGPATVDGHRLDPTDLTARLRAAGVASDCAVSVARDAGGAAQLVVHVVPAGDYDGAAVLATVRAVLAAGLDVAERPRGVVVPVSAIPRLPSGVPDLTALGAVPAVDRALLECWEHELATQPGTTGAAVVIAGTAGAGTPGRPGGRPVTPRALLELRGFVTRGELAGEPRTGQAAPVRDRFGLPTACPVTVVDELPRRADGSWDVTALAAFAAATTPVGGGDPAGPGTETERQIAAIWCEVLGRDAVGVDEDFFDLGGHSLRAAEVIFRIGERLDVTVPISALFEAPTVAGLAAAVQACRDGGPGAIGSTFDAAAETALAPDITPAGAAPADPARRADPAEVLLTGATGFLGGFLLAELLRRTRARIHCVVRAATPEAAAQRIAATMARYRLWDDAFAGRIVALPGDLGSPRLGLPASTFDELAGTLDLIVHNGAAVNLIAPYARLRAANVGGTEEVLRLAARTRVTPVHYVSTVGTVLAAADNPPLLTEDLRVAHNALVPGGYTLTKWVAEQLVGEAGARGLPVAIHRPGRVSGDSRTGVTTTDDILWSYLRAVVDTEAIPDDGLLRRLELGLVPVDYVAAALVEIALTRPAAGDVYHLANPRPTPLGDLLDRMHALGYAFSAVSDRAWLDRLRATAATGAAALEAVAAIEAVYGGGQSDADTFQVDDTNTRTALAGSPLSCPLVDAPVLDRYLLAAVDAGFLPAPADGRVTQGAGAAGPDGAVGP